MAASASTADRYGQAPPRMNSLKVKLQDPTVQGLLLLAPAVLVYALRAVARRWEATT